MGGGGRNLHSAPRAQRDARREIRQRQQGQQEIGRAGKLRPQQEFSSGGAEDDERQQMIGEVFRARTRALDDFEQEQQGDPRSGEERRLHPASSASMEVSPRFTRNEAAWG